MFIIFDDLNMFLRTSHFINVYALKKKFPVDLFAAMPQKNLFFIPQRTNKKILFLSVGNILII